MSNTTKIIAIVLLVLLAVAGVCLRFGDDVLPGGTGHLEACIVEDTATRTPATAQVVTSAKIRDYVKQSGIAWHDADADASGPDAGEVQWALTAAAKQKLPVLAVRSGWSTKVYPLGTEADVLKRLGEK